MEFQLDAEWLGRVLETIPGFVLVVDRARKIRYINRLEPGYDLDDVLGADSADFVLPDSREAHDAALHAAFETGETQEFEVKLDIPSGPAWYRTEVHPLRQDDHVVAVVLMATNITEIKAAQESAAQLRRLLPICSWCDRIQGEDGTWRTIEAYVKETARQDVTHGLCSDCYGRQMDELDDRTDGSVA